MIFWVLFLIRRLYYLEIGYIFYRKNEKLENHILSDSVLSLGMYFKVNLCALDSLKQRQQIWFMITLTQNSNLSPIKYCLSVGSESSFLSPDHQFQAINLRSSRGLCPGDDHIVVSSVLYPKDLESQMGQELHFQKALDGKRITPVHQFVKLCSLTEIKNSSLLGEGWVFCFALSCTS